MDATQRVLIIGGGFGGLYAAKRLSRVASCQITILDCRNFHLFQPLLYQVATGSLAPGNIASPLRRIVRRRRNVRVFQDEAIDLDPSRKVVQGRDSEYHYDFLIVATGVRHSYFGKDHWEAFAPGLKTIEDAVQMRRTILCAFESAEKASDPAARAAYLTFVIVGGGPTGVELAGALVELAKGTFRGEFRNIDPEQTRVILVEHNAQILGAYSKGSADRAQKALERMGVEVRTGTSAVEISDGSVTVAESGRPAEVIAAKTTLWAAGVEASAFARVLAGKAGARLHRSGRVLVSPDCSLEGRPEIFVVGDLAYLETSAGTPLPGVAQVAMQQGAYVSRKILAGQKLAKPFHYREKGSLAVIGRNNAVFELGRFRCTGRLAWLLWAVVHITFLIEFENKLSVIIQWAWTYFANGRGSRLITERNEHPA